jgi:hypothetical protein
MVLYTPAIFSKYVFSQVTDGHGDRRKKDKKNTTGIFPVVLYAVYFALLRLSLNALTVAGIFAEMIAWTFASCFEIAC